MRKVTEAKNLAANDVGNSVVGGDQTQQAVNVAAVDLTGVAVQLSGVASNLAIIAERLQRQEATIADLVALVEQLIGRHDDRLTQVAGVLIDGLEEVFSELDGLNNRMDDQEVINELKERLNAIASGKRTSGRSRLSNPLNS